MKERPYTGFYARLLGGFSLYYEGIELPIPANPQTKGMQILCMLLKADLSSAEDYRQIAFPQGEIHRLCRKPILFLTGIRMEKRYR